MCSLGSVSCGGREKAASALHLWGHALCATSVSRCLCRYFEPATCKLLITLHTLNIVATILAETYSESGTTTAFLAFLRKQNFTVTPNDAPSNHLHVHHISLGIDVTPMFHVPTIIGDTTHPVRRWHMDMDCSRLPPRMFYMRFFKPSLRPPGGLKTLM